MARILITDDDAYMLRILAMWLGHNGHQVVEARNGKLATKILENESIDLIVSDINMPEMSGVELAEWVRHERGLNTPMILLSSRCDQMQLSEKLGLPGISVHPKPFSPSRLMAQIDVALADPSAGINTATVGETPDDNKTAAVDHANRHGLLAHASGTTGHATGMALPTVEATEGPTAEFGPAVPTE